MKEISKGHSAAGNHETMPLMIYILLFVASAFFPRVLASYGANVGAAGTRNKKSRERKLLLILLSQVANPLLPCRKSSHKRAEFSLLGFQCESCRFEPV